MYIGTGEPLIAQLWVKGQIFEFIDFALFSAFFRIRRNSRSKRKTKVFELQNYFKIQRFLSVRNTGLLLR